MSTKRLTKRELREDPAIELMHRITEGSAAYGRQILIGLGVLVVAVLLGFLLSSQRKQNEELASEALLKAEFQMNSGDITGAAAALQDIVNRYSGSPSGRRAVRDLGDAMFYLGKNTDALKHYDKFLGMVKKGSIEEQAGLMGKAAVLDQTRQFAQAAETYGKVADANTTNEFGSIALWSQGRCYNAAGQYDKAAASFERLVREHPRSRYADISKQELAEAQARSQK